MSRTRRRTRQKQNDLRHYLHTRCEAPGQIRAGPSRLRAFSCFKKSTLFTTVDALPNAPPRCVLCHPPKYIVRTLRAFIKLGNLRASFASTGYVSPPGRVILAERKYGPTFKVRKHVSLNLWSLIGTMTCQTGQVSCALAIPTSSFLCSRPLPHPILRYLPHP